MRFSIAQEKPEVNIGDCRMGGKVYKSHFLRTENQIFLDHQMHFSSQLRFTNTLLLNLDADKEVLAERLFARVDGMMRRGLLEELAQFYGEVIFQ